MKTCEDAQGRWAVENLAKAETGRQNIFKVPVRRHDGALSESLTRNHKIADSNPLAGKDRNHLRDHLR